MHKSFKQFRNDHGPADKTPQVKATNAKLIGSFKGARTFKDKDGNVKPTAEWKAHLAKNKSQVAAKPKPNKFGKS